MRARSILVVALLAVPLAAEAQRVPVPRIRDRGPARPAPMPPVPRPIAREMVYVRLPYSVESYPLVSYFNAPGLNSWTAGGAGTRVDYRLGRRVSLTLDLTSSFVGGPAVTQTAEIGTRIRPEPSDRKWHPFLDLRAGYLNVHDRATRPYDFVDPSSASSYSRMNHGLGAVAGTGVEYSLTRSMSLTTAGSVFRTTLAPLYGSERPISGRYTMTAIRYSVGLRYNPGRWSMPPNLPNRVTQ
jgi:hypothetical protein